MKKKKFLKIRNQEKEYYIITRNGIIRLILDLVTQNCLKQQACWSCLSNSNNSIVLMIFVVIYIF